MFEVVQQNRYHSKAETVLYQEVKLFSNKQYISHYCGNETSLGFASLHDAYFKELIFRFYWVMLVQKLVSIVIYSGTARVTLYCTS